MLQWTCYAAYFLRLEGGLLADLLAASTAVLRQEGKYGDVGTGVKMWEGEDIHFRPGGMRVAAGSAGSGIRGSHLLIRD